MLITFLERTGTGLLAGLLLASCTAGVSADVDTECASFGATLDACGIDVPDLQSFCAARSEELATYSTLSCAELSGEAPKADFLGLGLSELGRLEYCWFNFECAGDLVCRPYMDPDVPYACIERANHAMEKRDRLCNSEADCQEGDRCFSAWGVFGTCESEMYGEACADQADCGPGVSCVEGLCRRPCAAYECPFESWCEGLLPPHEPYGDSYCHLD